MSDSSDDESANEDNRIATLTASLREAFGELVFDIVRRQLEASAGSAQRSWARIMFKLLEQDPP